MGHRLTISIIVFLMSGICSAQGNFMFAQHGHGGSCTCPSGYTQLGNICQLVEETAATPPVYQDILVSRTNVSYSAYGTAIFSSYNSDGTGTYSVVSLSNTFWNNSAETTTNGPLNRSGVWGARGSHEIGFTFQQYIPSSKIYYVGFGCDNIGSIKVNGTTIIQQDLSALNTMWGTTGDNITFRYWYIYPVQLSVGLNIIELWGFNNGGESSVGFEIYDATSAELAAATSYVDLGNKLIYSTKDHIGDPVYLGSGGVGYTCPEGYQLSVENGDITCVKITNISCQ